MQTCNRSDKSRSLPAAVFRGFAVAAVIAAALAGSPVTAGEEHEKAETGLPSGTWTITAENDRIARTDRHYTHGTRIAWVSDVETGGPEIVRETLDFLYPLADVSGGRIGFALGQSIFTPEDTDAAELIVTDRPYAGWTYASMSLYAEADWTTAGGASYKTLDSVELNLGIVGPQSYADETQNGFHDLIDVSRSNGWDNQLRNEPAVALFFERKWRPDAWRTPGGLELDAIPHLGGSLGNVFTLLNSGLTVRVGQGLETDFGPPQIRPAFSGPGAVSPETDFAWYLFAGTQASLVGQNIFLDGNTFTDSHGVDKEPITGDVQVGAAVVIRDVRVAAAHVYRTREFKGQRRADRFGMVSVSYHF
ncbi:MAG: lipid A deacylase LpxR family protein [Rhodospirillales bacterium]